MLDNLPAQPQDKILGLMQLYREDTRSNKIDLGVGVYKNAEGITPVMRAVKKAEEVLWQSQQTKAYTGLAGSLEYNQAMIDLVLGNEIDAQCVASAATPGGTGAIRQAFELIKIADPTATVWLSDPSWPNHASILTHLGIPMAQYRYFNKSSGEVDFEAMVADITKAKPGDVILLHGCCHNPTGANLTSDQWKSIVSLIRQNGLVAMVDIAYQGFGDGLEKDGWAVRHVAANLPEVLIAASCSKNFGIYRERTGILMVISDDKSRKAVHQGNLNHLNRQNFSFPPDHGASLVSIILNDEALKDDWQKELEEVRVSMLSLRQQLAAELRQRTNSDRFDFIAHHRGMFSLMGLSENEVTSLRKDHAVYMVGGSRINIAGLNEKTVPLLAEAVSKVIG